MKAGKFDRLVTLLKPGAAVDDGYTTLPGAHTSQGTRKAHYIPAMAREIFENAGREAELPMVFEFRSDTLTRQIDATWRLQYGNTVYDVKGVQEIGRREGVRISAVGSDEVVAES